MDSKFFPAASSGTLLNIIAAISPSTGDPAEGDPVPEFNDELRYVIASSGKSPSGTVTNTLLEFSAGILGILSAQSPRNHLVMYSPRSTGILRYRENLYEAPSNSGMAVAMSPVSVPTLICMSHFRL